MRVDNTTRSEREIAAAAAAQGGNVLTLAESFKATLQHHRRASEPTREDSRQRSSTRASTRADTLTRRSGGRALGAYGEQDAKPLTLSDWLGDESRTRLLRQTTSSPLPLTSSEADTGSAASTHTALRFRRAGTGSAAASCIEVVHARTGMRFVLSRDNDVWLLAIESGSAPHPAEMNSIIAMLNAQFAAQGLGPIDVILG